MKSMLRLLLCSFVFLCFACKPSSSPTNTGAAENQSSIKIGSVLSLTGSLASFGQSSSKGMQLAIKEINTAGGGLGGVPYELKLYDDKSKSEEAVTVMNRLVTEDKVVTVLGEATSTLTLAIAPIAQNYQIPLVSPSATNPKVTETGDFIFRMCFIDPFQGATMARFAKRTLNAKTVAVLRDVKNDYSVGLADFFTQIFTLEGRTISLDQSYSEGDVDFKSQLTAIKATNPDAIFVPGYYNEVGLILRQARELGITVPLMGGDGWDSPKLIEIAGDTANGNYFSNHYASEDPSPLVQNFVTSFKQTYGEIPDVMAVLGYDAMKALHLAITNAGSVEPAKIRAALASLKDVPAVSGTFTINDMRNATKPAVVLKIENGKYVFQERVNP